jgi:hypothetical protein
MRTNLPPSAPAAGAFIARRLPPAATTSAARRRPSPERSAWHHDRADEGGHTVTKLKAHTPYRFVIRDRATIHDFHLRGPGINRVLTSVAFQGTKSYTSR